MSGEPVGGSVVLGHHTWPDDLESFQKNELPKPLITYAVVRDPFDQLASWFYHTKQNKTTPFIDFVKNYDNQWFDTTAAEYPEEGIRTSMNMYRDVADRFFLYESGLDSIVTKLTGNGNINIPSLGGSGRREHGNKEYIWTPGVVDEFLRRFEQDVNFYQSILAEVENGTG